MENRDASAAEAFKKAIETLRPQGTGRASAVAAEAVPSADRSSASPSLAEMRGRLEDAERKELEELRRRVAEMETSDRRP
jgi:hypothetical protein